MSRADDQLIASLSKSIALDNQNTGIVTDNTQQQPITPAVNTEIVTPQPKQEPITPAAQATPATPEPPDYNKYIEELTGGQFKDADTLKQVLPRLSAYDTLVQERDTITQERDTFKAKAEADPFADEFVKKLDGLKRSGATPDQVKNYFRINEVGDIGTLSATDARVAKLVLVDGYKENIAKKMVEKEYPIADYEEGSDDREIIEERLRVDANNDRVALDKYKAQVATIANPNQDTQLQQVAVRQQHETFVKSQVPKIAEKIQGMGEIAFKDDKGNELAKLKFDYPADYKSQIAPKLEQYFMDGQTPINNETVQEAYRTVNAAYLDEHFPALAQRVWDSAYAKGIEMATNKYENRSGLPKGEEPVVNKDEKTAYNKFLKGLVGQQ